MATPPTGRDDVAASAAGARAFAPFPPSDGSLTSIDIGALQLESGAVLPDVTIAMQCWGTPNPNLDNIVLIEHALTGDSHVTGPAGPDHVTAGWWNGMVGPGAPIDTDEWCVLVTNVLGSCRGTTGPSTPAPDGQIWGSRFPAISIRDQVEAERVLADTLGIAQFATVIGGSLGGMRTLEWMIGHPDRIRSALLLAVSPRATADQIGGHTAQIDVIAADPNWHGGDYYGTGVSPDNGLNIARRFAHLTYRGAAAMDDQFANAAQEGEDIWNGGRYAVQSYLEYHANKLVSTFDAGSFVALTHCANKHDVGRGRGGIEAALRSTPVPVVVGAIDSDRIIPLHQAQAMAELLPGCDGIRVVHSPAGHDGFLTEVEWVTELMGETLALARVGRTAP
ncbi:homoserine O-acetyltransferase MetX [Rhodococcus tukisamuensis]|uniref:Homoserine O-acetyltransferase n=1 Tax=Rhodococcus tukisamuensis TaxID=168276 RepID=A0A1G6Y5P3_9NOCA|nr:homoserine O-acetyltransferase [Rhodococcus tukisamuensis]